MQCLSEARMFDQVEELGSSPQETMHVLLGCNTESRAQEDRTDHVFKRFLKRAWRARKRLTHALNVSLDRQD